MYNHNRNLINISHDLQNFIADNCRINPEKNSLPLSENCDSAFEMLAEAKRNISDRAIKKSPK